jgi:hypothetical protein
MATDFQFTVGTHKACVPSAADSAGTATAFPVGTTFQWTVDNQAITFDNAAAQSPQLSASAPVSGATITLTVQENGFTHSKSHTIDAVSAVADPISTVDFVVQ